MDQGANRRTRPRGRAWLGGLLAFGGSTLVHAAVFELAIHVGHAPVFEAPEHRTVEFTVLEPEPELAPPPPVVVAPPPPPPPRRHPRPTVRSDAPEVDTVVEGNGEGIGGALRWDRFRIYGEQLHVDPEVSGDVRAEGEPPPENPPGTNPPGTESPGTATAANDGTSSEATTADANGPATPLEPATERALLAVTFDGARLADASSPDGRVARGIARTLGLDSVLEGSGIDLASEVERLLLLSTDPTDPARLVVVARLSRAAGDPRERLGVPTDGSVASPATVTRWPGTREARVAAFVGERDLVICLRRDLVAVLGLVRPGAEGSSTGLLDEPADATDELLHADVTPTPSDDPSAPRLPMRLGLRATEDGGLAVEVRIVGGGSLETEALFAEDGLLGPGSAVGHLGLAAALRAATPVIEGSDRLLRATLSPEQATELAGALE